MIKAIIFDFFGVLVTEGFKQFCQTHFPGDIEKKRQATKLVNRHDMGQITAEDFYRGLAQIAGVDYETAKAINSNQPNQQLISYIRNELRPHYKLGVLSNSGDNYIARMLEPKDQELFDDIILSYRHNMIKPQKEIFALAADGLGVSPEQCVFIDDGEKHYLGAQEAGMQAIWYQTFEQMKAELEKILSANADN